MRSTALSVFLSAGISSAAVTLPPPATMKVDFDRDVKPLFAAKCLACHGSKVQQSGLRLDKRQNALRGGDYGPVIVQGKSAESKLILKLVNGDGGLQMPPSGALDKSDISMLRAWIDQGAGYGTVEIKEEPVKPVDPRLRDLISAVRSRDAKFRKQLMANLPLLNTGDAGGSTLLHHAAGFGDLATMKALLDAGADVHAKNRTGSAAIHWAVAEGAKLALLIEHGSDVNAKSSDGRTPLYMAATQRNSNAPLRLLLAKGADPNLAMLNGRTTLMAAAGAGDVEAMTLLLAKGADPKAISGSNSTALMDAASSRNPEAVRLLIEKGSDVNAATKRRNTALAMAAMEGTEESVRLLLERGADVNATDERGYTPLMYAAYSEKLPAGIVRMLLAKGANVHATGEGETAKSLAAKRGDNEVARLLGVSGEVRRSGGVVTDEPGSPEKRPIAPAVTKALGLLEKQSPIFVKTAGCNSCHNQNLPAAAAALARDRGIPAPKSIVELPAEMVERTPERAMDMVAANAGSHGYEFFGLAGMRAQRGEYTDSVAHFIKMMQTPQGKWMTNGVRPPLTSDDFITTAMAINALREFAPEPERADTDARIARAAAWLESAEGSTTQERAFRLLGLAWAKSTPGAIEKAATALMRTQRRDGGWSQLPSMGSDAYATGESLYAMHVAGKIPADNPSYQKGVRYLLRTQSPAGAWHVKTRSLPVQPYFQSGFPYDHDQWISAAGTSWAAMALTFAVGGERASVR